MSQNGQTHFKNLAAILGHYALKGCFYYQQVSAMWVTIRVPIKNKTEPYWAKDLKYSHQLSLKICLGKRKDNFLKWCIVIHAAYKQPATWLDMDLLLMKLISSLSKNLKAVFSREYLVPS